MDATTRWETEALRTGVSGRPTPPRPTAKRRAPVEPGRAWVTLREAESETGIPVNTLRKWARRSGLPSYLESDGETPVRMVDLDAVRDRARELGREVAPRTSESTTSGNATADVLTAPENPPAEPRSTPSPRSVRSNAEPRAPEPRASEPRESTPTERTPPDTMIVPIDAWNKMLAQLGNLHEAGQQLADARERAAKAETEAAFLRRRLAEIRNEHDEPGRDESGDAEIEPDDGSPEEASPDPSSATGASTTRTTSFLRYVAAGWRNRRRAAD